MAESLEKEYDVFLVHCTDDRDLAIQIKQGLASKGLNVFAHYDEGTVFEIGMPTVDCINKAVKISKIVLILLTENALQSHWVSYEILLSLERSHREKSMCCRICMVGISEEERAKYQTGELKLIPSVIIDLKDESWVDEIVNNIKAEVHMGDILPSGNVAVGLVFNYFVGYLRQVLPGLKKTIQKSDFYKDSSERMFMRLIILLPSSCVVPEICGGGEGRVPKIKKEGSLSIQAAHGDKSRPYNPVVYSIALGEEKWYFLGECPAIIETMSKLKKYGFVEIDIKLQVERFRITLQELVQHRNNHVCNNTVSFIVYDDNTQTPQEVIQEKLLEEKMMALKLEDQPEVVRHVTSGEEGKENFASITGTDTAADRLVAMDIMKFLAEKKKPFSVYANKLSNKELEDSRWNIFIFSKESIVDPIFTSQYSAAIHASIDDNQLQVIPVVSKGVLFEEIPSNYKWITLLHSDDANFTEKLWHLMESEPPTMTELIPAGEVYKGLAWAYLLNYLPLALLGTTEQGRGLRERFEDAMVKYNVDCPCIPRVFIVIPKSCTFPPPKTQFKGEEHIGELEPVVVGFRKYLLQLYKVTTSNGKQYCYAREYATPVIAMHEMADKYKFAGLSKDNLYSQTELFTDYIIEEIRNERFKSKIGDLESRLWLVNYDDMTERAGEKISMVQALEKEIEHCLKWEQIILPRS